MVKPGESHADKPHIVQLIGTFDGGGAERVAYNLTIGLHDIGVQSTGIAMRQLGRFPDERPEVNWLALNASPGISGRVGLVRRLRRWIHDARPDLIWVHGTGTLLVATAAIIGLRDRPRIWFTWHNSENVLTEPPVKRWIFRYAINRCQRVFGPSSSVLSRLLASGIEQSKTSIFTNGVAELGATSGIENSIPAILWAGRLGPLKDPIALVTAAAKLRDVGLSFRITIAGNATPNLIWYEKDLQHTIEKHNLTDFIVTPGWMEDVTSLYRHAAIGVQTSHTEGLSMTLLEQMMAGLAIVATDVGDTAFAIEHEKTGLLIPSGDDQALIEALTRVITDRDLRIRLGRNARADAIQRFTCRAMAEAALKII